MLFYPRSNLKTAQGKFSSCWVAIYEGANSNYYGYGNTEEEARQDLEKQLFGKINEAQIQTLKPPRI